MRIDGLSHQPKISQSQQRGAPVRSKSEGERADDVVEISQGAKEVSELSALARAESTETNPRIDEIKQRVESGYYNARQVREQIADSLLESSSVQSEVADIAVFKGAQQQLENVPDVRENRVNEARQRVESGFYDQTEVRLETADRILDEMA
jgi:anti-sigma28 factor (negative regulator of flagellin synthesis)